MKLTFLGADHEVTGSCHFIEACGKNILVDCGMEQGNDTFVNQEIPVNPNLIDYVILTHAHIDHSGLLPLIYKNGFDGEIYSTKATCELCDIMLKDSAHIQEFEAEWRNRKGKRAGKEEVIPLYETEHAIGVMEHFKACRYEDIIEICDGIKIRFTDVGHLLGSSSVEIWLCEEGINKKLVFSGDIGNINQPLISDPSYTADADYVVMESTYGDRNHGERIDYVGQLARIIQETFDRGGNVVIPSFAVGRTQEMLYFLRKIKAEKMIEGHRLNVYLDSPLAVEATEIFHKNVYDCFDTETIKLIKKGINPLEFEGLHVSVSSEDSKAINSDEQPKVILSASGMCEAGRIRHHLKHNLWRPECTILFVGYQAIGTLGRSIIEGAKSVKLFGETIEVKAKIERLSGISGHADQNGLFRWINAFTEPPTKVFVVHGDEEVCEIFTEHLKGNFGYNAYAPYSGCVWDLAENKMLFAGVKKRVEKKEAAIQPSTYYGRLLSAGNRLMEVIKHNEGGANRDLEKFEKLIQRICDEWDI